jgi:putative cell wall-binding protein
MRLRASALSSARDPVGVPAGEHTESNTDKPHMEASLSHNERRTTRLVAGITAGVLGVSAFAALAPAASAKDFAQVVNSTTTLAGANVGGSARLSGANRYATASAVALATYPTGGKAAVVLASGTNFPDGLAASALAGQLDTAVLLTDPNSLPTETVNALATLTGGSATKVVHIMGGTAAVSQAVRDQLKALGYTLNESYSGADRYETALKIATAIGVGNVGGVAGKRTAILATGGNFADALAAGSAAFANRMPIILTDTNTLSASAKTALTSLGIANLIIMGGTAAISQAVQDAVVVAVPGITITRQAGANRADTAVKLAQYNDANLAGIGYVKASVVLFNGYSGFADGLTAGPHAGKIRANLLPVGSVPPEVAAYVTSINSTLNLVQGIGGTAVIDDATLTAVITGGTITSPSATFIATEGQQGFTVLFSAAVDPVSAATPGNYQISSSNAAISGVVGVSPGTVGATGPGGTVYVPSFKVTIVTGFGAGDGLLAGDIVSLKAQPSPNSALSFIKAAGSVTTFVPVSTGTVTPDVTKPTVTITAAAGATQFVAAFSEPVTGLVPGDFLVNGVAATALSAGCGSSQLVMTCLVTAAAPMVALQTISVAADAFTDKPGAVTGQNGNLAVNATIQTDSSAPTLVSASTVTSKSGTDGLTVTQGGNSITLTSKLTGFSATSFQIVAAGTNTAPAV